MVSRAVGNVQWYGNCGDVGGLKISTTVNRVLRIDTVKKKKKGLKHLKIDTEIWR